jgi:hypothetical protein
MGDGERSLSRMRGRIPDRRRTSPYRMTEGPGECVPAGPATPDGRSAAARWASPPRPCDRPDRLVLGAAGGLGTEFGHPIGWPWRCQGQRTPDPLRPPRATRDDSPLCSGMASIVVSEQGRTACGIAPRSRPCSCPPCGPRRDQQIRHAAGLLGQQPAQRRQDRLMSPQKPRASPRRSAALLLASRRQVKTGDVVGRTAPRVPRGIFRRGGRTGELRVRWTVSGPFRRRSGRRPRARL